MAKKKEAPITSAELKAANKREQMLRDRIFYRIRSIVGHSDCIFFFLLGGPQTGKSYSVTDFYCEQYVKYKTPFYWIRLTDTQSRKLLNNNAEKLVDPDLRRKYNLDLVTSGTNVYNVTKRGQADKKTGQQKIIEKELFARVLNLSTFYADKGNGFYDKDYKGWYNVAVDEFEREKGEVKRFDILYALVRELENLVRATKNKIRVFFLGNTLEQASDILCGLNFLPERWGRFKLIKNKKKLHQYLRELEAAQTDAEVQEVQKKYRHVDFGKRAVIDYMEPSDAYKTMRKGSIADILLPNNSQYTNIIDTDRSLVYKGRLTTPISVIKFSKDKADWYTVWDNNCIAKYQNEKKPVIAMRPYLDEMFSAEQRDNVIKLFDTRSMVFRNLITFKRFQNEIMLLKPRNA